MVDGAEPALHDQLVIQNFGRQVADFALSFKFRTAFEDVYAVRGFRVQQLGVLHEPAWRNDMLYFFYAGKDGLYRSLAVHFSVRPQRVDGGRVFFRIKLRPREATQLLVSFVVSESHEVRAVSPKVHSPNFGELKSALQDSSEAWLASVTRITSDNPILEQVIRRSMLDLHLLQSNIEDHTFLIAGMPWYATLFGRDSLLGALQILAYDPSIAEQTLRLLAKYQGQREDEWRDEQPGKIPHELRQGELAHLGMIPHTPYYGTIDATPLFLILLGQHAAWTGTLALFHELRGAVERALEWMATYGDRHGASYLAYESRSRLALTNQGWKDSGEAIVNTDGSLAQPPIALVEVQGYVYLAKLVIADLYDRIGEPMPARRLREEAGRLRSRFNRDFWLEAKRCYALALQRDDKPAAVVASNAGQVLWTGIADAGKAALTVDRLMAPDMFNGWGIRTLSENEEGYSPIGYHIGTVWPHDNSLIAAGFRRYGHDRAACRIFTGLLDAAMHLKAYRLPELFAGYSRASYEVPVVYAAANPPQAWAACAMPYFIQTLLGLRAEGLDRRLRILRPVLPDGIDELEVHGLRVGQAAVDLQFTRKKDSAAHVRTLRVEGPLEIVVEQKTSA
jgi:glycogen debranching enzyme